MTVQRLLRAALAAALFLASVLAPAQSKEAPAAPAPEMTTYYVVFLVKGDAWTPGGSPEHQKLQERHIGHLKAMHEAGKLVIAGPFLDGQTIRGICVYKTASAEEARTLAEGDPAVKSGRLKVEVHPWMVQKGILP
ncbi:MAG: YciI family protein [Thermoanaerobaculia bacterium]